MPDAETAQHKTPAASPSPTKRRRVRVTALPVAQIFDVGRPEVLRTGDVTLAVLVGAVGGEPHVHGLRAPRGRWLKLIRTLIAQDPALGEALRAA